jgi:hypothetical protein
MRWREGRQRLDQTSLCTRSKVRVHVRALLGSMPELCLHRLDGMAARDRLACDRVTPEGVVTQGSAGLGPPVAVAFFLRVIGNEISSESGVGRRSPGGPEAIVHSKAMGKPPSYQS